MSDKQSSSNGNMTRKQRRAAERAARKSGKTTSSNSSTGSDSGSSRSMLVIGGIAVAIGLVVVVGLVLISGGLGNDAAAVSEPDTPPPAAELRDGRTLVAADAVDPVVVEVFEDPQCPHCQTFTEQVEPLLIAEHVADGTASLTYNDYIVFGDGSIDAAVAMRAADELDGAFWDYHHALFHNAPDGPFTREWLIEIAELIGLDAEAFEALLDDDSLVEAVAADQLRGSEYGVTGTPALVVNGELLGAVGWEDLDAAVESAAAGS